MARYSLIMKDTTFIKCMEAAQEQGLSFGKWINQKLDEWSRVNGREFHKMCVICANKPIGGIKVNGVSNYLCNAHAMIFENAGYQVARWKE